MTIDRPKFTIEDSNPNLADSLPVADWSIPIAVLGPLSGLMIPVLIAGGAFTGLFPLVGLLLFWHMAGPILLFVNEVLRHRRGLSVGRDAKFGICYFLVMDLFAVLEGRRSVIFLDLLLEKGYALNLLIFIGACSAILFLFSMYRRLGKRSILSAWDDFFASVSIAGLATIGLVVGLTAWTHKVWSDDQQRNVTIHLLDAVTHEPVSNADLEFKSHIEGAKTFKTSTDSQGIGKVYGWSDTRVFMSRNGYMGEVAWMAGDAVYLSWEEADGYMTPFMAIANPSSDWRNKSVTLYLKPKGGQAKMPYNFFGGKAVDAKIYKSILEPEYSDPNTLNPEGLPEDVKASFIAFQARRLAAEKRFLRVDFASTGAPDGVHSYRSRTGKMVPYHYGKYFGIAQRAELAIRSLVEGEDLDQWIKGYFTSERQRQDDRFKRRPYKAWGLNREYLDANPNSPLIPYVLLLTLHQHRSALAYTKLDPPRDDSYMLDQADLDRYEGLCKQALRHPDPLVRYMANEIIKTPDRDFSH